MAKHTPGPWEYGQNAKGQMRVFDASGWEIVRALSGNHYTRIVPKDEVAANAKLIAAAPDLLAACEATVRYDDAIRKRVIDGKVSIMATGGAIAMGDDLDQLYVDMADKARAAIAAARG